MLLAIQLLGGTRRGRRKRKHSINPLFVAKFQNVVATL